MDSVVLIDAHVHVYPCFNMDCFFDAAWKNFLSATQSIDDDLPTVAVLALTEGSGHNWFRGTQFNIKNRMKNISDGRQCHGNWRLEIGQEPNCIRAIHTNGAVIHLIAGRQIISKERLEVLAIGVLNPFPDGNRLMDIVSAINKIGGIAVLSWGAGKWIGYRGRLIHNIIRMQKTPDIFLGDNGNRPFFWPLPPVFNTAGISNLPGSDPLPFPNETYRPGGYGATLSCAWDENSPASSLIAAIKSHHQRLQPFGKTETVSRFFCNQTKMQWVKMASKK